jgi:diacylglycerol O-acyltransferase
VERLTVRDISNLRIEDHGFPMHVAALLILDGATLSGADGTFGSAALAAEIERRTRGAPRLRQVLRRSPTARDTVLLVDDPAFDISRHVFVRGLPAGADEAAMLEACAEINRPRLDRSRPLWQLWFLHGLPEAKVAVLLRLHHVIADGLAAVALLSALLDGSPQAPKAPPTPIASAHPIARTPSPSRRVEGAVRAVRRFLAEGLAPRTSLNATLGDERILFLARGDLERARSVAHEHGGTVNDIMLAAVTAGARGLLSARGELRPGLELKASVPVSRRAQGDPRAGNDVGVMIAPLPVGIDDPSARLDRIVRATRSWKRDPHASMGWDVGSALLQRAVVGVMRHQRFINLLLSNVPGPTEPLRLAGAPVDEAFQVAPIQGNVTVGVGALSYAGQLNLDVVADASACPDAAVFADGLRDELASLGAAR